MKKLIEILKEIEINQVIYKAPETEIFNDLNMWIGGETELGFVTGYEFTPLKAVYSNIKSGYEEGEETIGYSFKKFEEYIKPFNNKILKLETEGETTYIVIKDYEIVGVNDESSYRNSILTGQNIEKQKLDDAINFLTGKEIKISNEKINLNDTDFYLYKLEMKGYSTHKVEGGNNYGWPSKEDESSNYYFLYPDKSITLDNIEHKVSFWGADPYFIYPKYKNYSSSGRLGSGEKMYTQYILEDLKLSIYKNIELSKSTYNVLLNDFFKSKGSNIEPIKINKGAWKATSKDPEKQELEKI